MIITPIRVYYEDTDAGGIVYYANYLKFCERGRTEFLRSMGFEHKSLLENDGILFVVRHVSIDYLAPAFLDDAIEVCTWIGEVGKTRLLMKQLVRRDGKALSRADVTLVCVNREGRPTRPPDYLGPAFEKLVEQYDG